MARARGNKQYLGFTKGLITEASLLDFPEGATVDEQNFLFEVAGHSRNRRQGLINDVADLVVDDPLSGSDAGITDMYHWLDADYYVVARNSVDNVELLVYTDESPYVFQGKYDVPIGAANQTTPYIINFTEIRGNLLVSIEGTKPRLITNEDNVLSFFIVDLFVRDFELVDDDLNITERPVGLTDEHKYNLLNAGWWQDRKVDAPNGPTVDPIEEFYDGAASAFTVSDVTTTAPDQFASEDTQMLVFATAPIDTEFTVTSGITTATYTLASYSYVDPVYTITVNEGGVSDSTAAELTFELNSIGYPSNADISYLGMKANDKGYLEFDPSTLVEFTVGNTPAPRGHYVYNILDFDRNARLQNKLFDGAPSNSLTIDSTGTKIDPACLDPLTPVPDVSNSLITSVVPATATAKLFLYSNGAWSSSGTGGTGLNGTWLLEGLPEDVEVRITETIGTLSVNPAINWSSMSSIKTAEVTATVPVAGVFTKSCTFTIEFRDSATLAILSTTTGCVLSADVEVPI